MPNRRRLVIVPARAGSKRILNKNTYPIQGKPIILHALEILKKSDLFTDILVSTDSPEILKLCQFEGIKQNSLRPASLSDDQTPLIDVLKYEFEKQYRSGSYYDELWLYSATACLISVEELIEASIEFLSHDANDPLLAVTKFNTPIEWALNIDKNSRLVPRNMLDIKKKSQDFEVTYFDAGCFAIYNYESFLESDISFRNISYRPFVLPKYAAIDVDEIEDMHLVEKLFNAEN